ncbi:NAD(P)H-dependent FMN reductase [Mucilaginibacter lappiensis]|uniref:NAD(P)H-dependent FMN reductase n=1 Tax=Mucilaginibacter lappiensis TaxID=354630 RepID=A0ABR6PI80_9SPHI|nr:NAD(P)H-dependent oxidoreductase [Mucilaginibacter lappiensis]MBB6109356.1 NAD(P)H-dependent FMN reductase [Mucilaginibacter lappiensis]SIQ98717.1 NAD(P)H-dependent FMN reductase [Mucilaginibacter lappiensis]
MNKPFKTDDTPILKGTRILAISGSLRFGSSNHHILKYLATQVPADVNFTIYDELALIPPFDPGLDNDSPPEPVANLRELLAAVDGVIICTPEYAFGVPGQLKNMLDWLVSSSSLVKKPVALITASLGGEHAHASLLLTLGALNSSVIDGATLVISFIRSKINAEGHIIHQGTEESLKIVLHNFLTLVTDSPQ